MKKTLSLLLICIMLSCSLAGCGSSDSDYGDFFTVNGRTFVQILATGRDTCIVVDIQEKTQYLYLDAFGHGGGLTLLVDSEGKPILYEGEIPYYGGEVGK